MTPKSLSILTIVTLVITAGAGWVWSNGRQANTDASSHGQPLFPALAAADADIAHAKVQATSYSLDFARKGDDWVASGHGDYPASDVVVNRFVSQVAALRAWEAKTSDPALYSYIGVQDPGSEGAHSSLVSLTGPDDKVLASAIIGGASKSIGADPLGGIFVRRPDEAQAWLAQGNVSLPVAIGDWFDPVVHIPGTEVNHISISEGGAQVFAATKADGEIAYQLDSGVTSLPGVANDENVKRMTQGLLADTLIDVRAQSEVSFAPDGRVIEYGTKDGLRITAKVGQADGKSWVAFHAEAPEGGDATAKADEINARTKDWAFLFAVNKMAAYSMPLSDLLQPANTPPVQSPMIPGMPAAPGMPMPPGMPFAPGMPMPPAAP